MTRDKKIQLIDSFISSKVFPKLRQELDTKISFAFNSYLPQKLNLDREIISDKFYSIADKSYYCRIFDSEGVKLTKPKIKIVGLAVKKSNTPSFFRTKVLEILELLLDEDYTNIDKLIQEHKEQMYNSEPEELSSNINVNSIDYEFDENKKLYQYKDGKKLPAPIHSRGAIFHNLYVKKNNLNLKLIENGQKCKMISLKLPNPINSDILSYYSPEIFKDGLKDYIDYEGIFEKFYLGILKLVREPLNLYKETLSDEEW